jgi:ubiquinone/menaquinone biosynthesis C-methylase UbiE
VDEAYESYCARAKSLTFRSIWADVYGNRFWEGCAPPWTLATIDDIRFVVDKLDPQGSSRFLDLGCGSGCLGRHLADRFGSHTVGVDVSPVAVRFAQEHSRGRHHAGKLTFETADIAATGLSDNVFDGAASLDVLLFVTDKASVLRETRRVLKPGARFAGTTFELRTPSVSLAAPAFEDYTGAFEAAGLVVEVYEETEAWRPLLEGVLAGILARAGDLGRELPPATHERVRNWAQRRPSELGDSRRTRFCVRKPQ